MISLRPESLVLFSSLDECWLEVPKIHINSHKKTSIKIKMKGKQPFGKISVPPKDHHNNKTVQSFRSGTLSFIQGKQNIKTFHHKSMQPVPTGNEALRRLPLKNSMIGQEV